MEYIHIKGPILGVIFLYIAMFHYGEAIRCFTCDVTSAASYADANERCNQEGVRECSSNEDSACMLEGFLRETNTVRVSKKCMRGCPLYINTTAEVVRCCTEDGCNEKFEPMPARRPPLMTRGYNPNRGYNVGNQGTNRPYSPNSIDIKRLDQGPGKDQMKDKKMINKPSKPTPLPENNEVTSENAAIDAKINKDKAMIAKKKLERKQSNERNSLAEQKSKKSESSKASSGTVVHTPSVLMAFIAGLYYFASNL